MCGSYIPYLLPYANVSYVPFSSVVLAGECGGALMPLESNTLPLTWNVTLETKAKASIISPRSIRLCNTAKES